MPAMPRNIGRNEACTCGSGKKYKKCCIDKLPRKQYVYVGYREPFQGATTFQDGQVLVHLPSGEKVRADATFTQTQYTRRNGKDKILTRVSNGGVFNIPLYLSSSFDLILAIDTNTKLLMGHLVSISCVMECYTVRTTATQVDFAYRRHGNLAFKDCQNGEAEKLAWSMLVRIVTSNPKYNEKLRVAVITDHDLDSHSKYNNGQLPIYHDTYLPANFTLLYASSDAGNDNVLNRFIRECDQDATNILRQLEKKGSVTIGDFTMSIDMIPDVAYG